MSPTKQIVTEVLANLPDEATLEDLIYQIYVRAKSEGLIGQANLDKILQRSEFDMAVDRWGITGIPPQW